MFYKSYVEYLCLYHDCVRGTSHHASFVKIEKFSSVVISFDFTFFAATICCFSVGAGVLAYFGAGRGTHYMYFSKVN